MWLCHYGCQVHRGVARNKYLEGPGCNRDILNIILKSIEYKIINFHISSYTWTCWEFNWNSNPVRNKKIEKTKREKKNNHTHKTVFTWFSNLPMSSELQGFPYYQRKLQCVATVFFSLKNNNKPNPNHKKKTAFISCAQDSQWATKRIGSSTRSNHAWRRFFME